VSGCVARPSGGSDMRIMPFREWVGFREFMLGALIGTVTAILFFRACA